MPSPAVVLYVPGINELAGSGVIDEVAQRIARSLEHQDEVDGLTYEVSAVSSEPDASGTAFFEVRHVLRRDSADLAVLTHRVYHLDYHALLADEQLQVIILPGVARYFESLRLGRRKRLGRARAKDHVKTRSMQLLL